MIHFENGEIALIRLDNPKRHNALSTQDFVELHQILDALEAGDARALILTASGESFCSGVEFESLQTGDWAHDNPLNKLCERMSKLPMPSIASLNGSFIGGGAELAFSCDFRLAVPTAKCRIPAAGIAVHYEPTGIERVVGVVGLQTARRLFLGFESFQGEDLLRLQFVDGFAEDVEDAARRYAKRITGLSPKALAGMKMSLNALRDGNADDARGRIEAAFSSADFQEAMQAVREKRAPKFDGR